MRVCCQKPGSSAMSAFAMFSKMEEPTKVGDEAVDQHEGHPAKRAKTATPTFELPGPTEPRDAKERARMQRLAKAGKAKAKAAAASSPWERALAVEDLFCGTSFGGMKMPSDAKHKAQHEHEPDPEAEHEPMALDSADHQYILETCVVEPCKLSSFDDIHGVPLVIAFADDFAAAAGRGGAVKANNGLLLFGPPGTGKSVVASALARHLKLTFIEFGSKDMPSDTVKGAARLQALLEIAKSKPSAVLLDEVDTMFSKRGFARAGNLARVWERFTPGLLIVGTSNDPVNIAPKVDARFVRKILVDYPNPAARRALILRLLSQEDEEPLIATDDISYIVNETRGRSAVNLIQLVSTACLRAEGTAVCRADFELALEEEPSDYDAASAKRYLKYNISHGWKKRLLPFDRFKYLQELDTASDTDSDGDGD